MKDNTLYKFFQNDKYIAMLAIFLIFLSIVTVALSYMELDSMILLLSLLTSFSLVILAICYLAIYQYYFERMKLIRLLPASEELLGDRLERYGKWKNKSK